MRELRERMYAKDLAQCVSLQDLLSSVSAAFLCRSHIRYFQSLHCPFSAVLGPHSKPGTYRSVRLRANYSLWAESPACHLSCTPVELNNSFYIFNRKRKIVLFQRRLLSCDVWELNEIQISGSILGPARQLFPFLRHSILSPLSHFCAQERGPVWPGRAEMSPEQGLIPDGRPGCNHLP